MSFTTLSGYSFVFSTYICHTGPMLIVEKKIPQYLTSIHRAQSTAVNSPSPSFHLLLPSLSPPLPAPLPPRAAVTSPLPPSSPLTLSPSSLPPFPLYLLSVLPFSPSHLLPLSPPPFTSPHPLLLPPLSPNASRPPSPAPPIVLHPFTPSIHPPPPPPHKTPVAFPRNITRRASKAQISEPPPIFLLCAGQLRVFVGSLSQFLRPTYARQIGVFTDQ